MGNSQMPPISKYININGIRLRYLDWGTRGLPPLVCLHDRTGQAHAWDEFALAMRCSYHIYAVDLRGHGESGYAMDGYSQHSFVEDLAMFVDALELERCTLVGLSMGGWHSMLYTAAYPDRVERLVIVDVGPEPSNESFAPPWIRPETPMHFDTLEGAVEWMRARDPWASSSRLAKEAHDRMKQSSGGWWTWKADPELFLAHLWDVSDPEQINRGWEALNSITCPILEVRGTESTVVSDDVLHRMKDAAADLKSVDVVNAGHLVTVDQPKKFIAATREFLGATG